MYLQLVSDRISNKIFFEQGYLSESKYIYACLWWLWWLVISGHGVDEKSLVTLLGKWDPVERESFRKKTPHLFSEDHERHFQRWDDQYVRLLKHEFVRFKVHFPVWFVLFFKFWLLCSAVLKVNFLCCIVSWIYISICKICFHGQNGWYWFFLIYLIKSKLNCCYKNIYGGCQLN